MKRTVFRVLPAALLVWIVVGGHGQESGDAATNLASRLAAKRSEVESLSNTLELTKTEYNEKLRSLATQRADIETQINREELRLAQIQQDLGDYRSRIQANRSAMDAIEPLVAQVLAQTKAYIQRGLPFKVQERMAEVETLERLLAEESLETEKVLARLWNLLESEFRLTTESGLYQQTIVLDQQPQLAEVARLGMTLLYFKTFDDEYGYALPTDAGWRYQRTTDRDEERQIAQLFDSIRKNLREGFFTLPNPRGR